MKYLPNVKPSIVDANQCHAIEQQSQMGWKVLTLGSIASQTDRLMKRGCDVGAALGVARVLGLEVRVGSA